MFFRTVKDFPFDDAAVFAVRALGVVPESGVIALFGPYPKRVFTFVLIQKFGFSLRKFFDADGKIFLQRRRLR